MPPKFWYPYTKLNVVTIRNSTTLIFTPVVTLKSHVVLPSFPFPVNLTQSVYTSHGPKQTSTECYCRLRIVWDIQRKVSTGGQLVWQAKRALKVNTCRKLCKVCCVMCSRNTSYVSVRALFTYDVSGVAAVCCSHTFHQILQQTDTHQGFILCVSVTQHYLGVIRSPLSYLFLDVRATEHHFCTTI